MQQSKSSQSNQLTPNPDHDRPGQPFVRTDRTLLELTREPRKMEEKRSVPRRSIHVLFTKKLSKTIERATRVNNPL